MTRNAQNTDRRDLTIGILFALVALIGLAGGLWFAPSEGNQGEVYRIMYLHVPAAFAAFLAALVLCIYSILTLVKGDERWLHYQRACCEVGLLFTVLTLMTGAIWGKPTWGTYWTWDARLTTTLLLGILYAAYLLLYNSLAPGRQRARICSVLGIIIFADVPIIYQSVTWWRTLHQPPSLLRPGGSTMDPEIRSFLLFSVAAVIMLAMWLVKQRARNIALAEKLQQAAFLQMDK